MAAQLWIKATQRVGRCLAATSTTASAGQNQKPLWVPYYPTDGTNHTLVCKARHGGPDIRIESQPAKSPDMNANDLGFYNSIDSKIPNPRLFDCGKLFKCCEKAWKEYDTSIPDKIFDSRSRIMISIGKILATLATHDYSYRQKAIVKKLSSKSYR